VRVTVGEHLTAEVPVPKPAKAVSGNRLGLKLRALTAAESKALDIPFGLIIESVSGPAATTRIQPGDVITRVGQTALTSAEQFQQLLKGRERGDPVALLVRRGEDALFVVVNVA
jgi:serine protease Do